MSTKSRQTGKTGSVSLTVLRVQNKSLVLDSRQTLEKF